MSDKNKAIVKQRNASVVAPVARQPNLNNNRTLTASTGAIVMRGFIVLSRNTSTTWSGPVYFFQEKNGMRFGECYTQEKATIVSRQRFDELKDKRIIPEKAEFVCVV